jgi:hypothetical protein
MAQKPEWVVVPVTGVGAVSAGNNVFDGSGTIGTSSYATVVPAVTAQTLFYFLETIATGATSASGGLIYWVRVSGANRWLVAVSLVTPSVTPGATNLPFRASISRLTNPVVLESGESLAAYCTVANPLQFRALGGRP